MESGDIGFVFAFVGLGSALALNQIYRTSAVAGFTALLVIAALWRIAVDLHWWTVLAFIVVSFVVGISTGTFTRRRGRGALLSARFPVAATALVSTPLAWLLR